MHVYIYFEVASCNKKKTPVLEVFLLLAYDLEAHGLVAHAVPPQDVHGAVEGAPRRLVLVEQVSAQEHKVHLQFIVFKRGTSTRINFQFMHYRELLPSGTCTIL